MTTEIKKIYKSGLKNDKFIQAIKDADNDEKPNVFSSDLEKHLFASIYYGWLVSEHGIAWKLHL